MQKHFLLAALFAATTAGSLRAQSAWLPEPGQLIVTPGYNFQTFDEFFAGTTRSKLPADLTQHTAVLTFEYGLLRDLAVDLTLGYVWTRFRPPGGPAFTSDGLTDTQLGLRFRLLDERRGGAWTPTLSLRVGAIIAGTYDVFFAIPPPPINPGDGADGVEFSLLTGKTFGQSGFGVFADFGYRVRNGHVPDDLFGRAGIFQQIGPVTLGVDYRQVQALSGGDIGGRGFGTAYGFPQVREVDRAIDAGITFTDRGGRGYQFTYSKTINGRNTGDKSIFGVSISLPWELGRSRGPAPSPK